jgi:amidase
MVRTAWFNAFMKLFDRFDYVISPTAQVFPFAVETHWPSDIGGRPMATYHEWMKGVCLITMTGCPSLAVPAGFSPAGQPMGLQIIAPIHREADCLKLAYAYDEATRWPERVKPKALFAGS